MAAPYVLIPSDAVQVLNAVTTGSGILMLKGQCARLTVVLQSNGTTSGGAITIEEAYYDPQDAPYTGTWGAVGTAINASTFTGNAQQPVHALGSFWAVRIRVSSNITGGGTVTAWAWGN